MKKVGVALDIYIQNDMVDTCHRRGKKPDGRGPPDFIVRRMDA